MSKHFSAWDQDELRQAWTASLTTTPDPREAPTNEAIRAALSDGKWRTTREVYETARRMGHHVALNTVRHALKRVSGVERDVFRIRADGERAETVTMWRKEAEA